MKARPGNLPRVWGDPQIAIRSLRDNILDFRGFDSNINLEFKGGILMSMGNFTENLSQAILVGIILVGRFGVRSLRATAQPFSHFARV